MKWDKESRLMCAADLRAFAKARKYTEPQEKLPKLQATWESLDAQFRESLRLADGGDELDYDAFDNLTAFARIVGQCAPEFLEQFGFPNKYEAEITSVLYNAESEVSEHSYTSDPDELRTLAGRKDSIAASLESLDELAVGHAVKANALADRLRERSSELEQEAAENEPPEPDPDYEGGTRSRDEGAIFDVGKLFSEL